MKFITGHIFTSKKLMVIAFIVSLLLNLGSLYFFLYTDYLNNDVFGRISTVLWIVSIIVWGGSIFSYREKTKAKNRDIPFNLKEKLLFIGILLFALAIRLYKIDHLGTFLDDWYWLNHARQILNGQINTPFGFIGDQPSNLPAFFVAFFYSIFNHTYLATRLTGITFSLINLILVFFLAKEFFNKKVAFFSAILITISIWDIYVSKVPWINTTINPMLITGSILFLYRALKYFSPKDTFWAGIFIGISLNLIYLAAINALLLFAFSVIKLLMSRKKSLLIWAILLVSYSSFLVSSPTFAKIINYRDASLGRHQIFINKNIGHSKQEGGIRYYAKQLSITLNSFTTGTLNYQKNTFPYWGVTIEPLLQGLLVLGLAYILINIKKEQNQLLLSSFIFMFIPLVVLERGISEWREYGFFSHIYLFAALGIYFLGMLVIKALRPGKKTVWTIVSSSLLIIYLLGWPPNFRNYYKHNIAVNPFEYEAQCKEISEYILNNFTPDTLILVPNEICKEMISVRIWDIYQYAGYNNLADIEGYMAQQNKLAIFKLAINYPFNNNVLGEFELESYLLKLNYQKLKIPPRNSFVYFSK